jgi:hypothetical protein
MLHVFGWYSFSCGNQSDNVLNMTTICITATMTITMNVTVTMSVTVTVPRRHVTVTVTVRPGQWGEL